MDGKQLESVRPRIEVMDILIADDSATSRSVLKSITSKCGHEPIVVPDGLKAWDILKGDNAPRLAILDWMMPGLDGLELCRKVRESPSTFYTYIILVTGRNHVKDLVAGLEAGADDYIIKPFEIQELHAHLNAASRIINLQRELASLNESLEVKVDERTAEVHDLLRQKNEFVYRLGHDLKTPLTPLVALLPMIYQQTKDEKTHKILRLAIENVDYMRNLTEKTIKLAHLNEIPDTQCDTENIDLMTTVESVVRGILPLLKKKNIVVFNNISEPVGIKMDFLDYKELMHNLISNAIKYTNNNGTITINASRDEDKVTLSITDTGIGMTGEQIQRAFEEFYKADPSRHDRSSTGLGLPICKRIVNKNGGEIRIESPGLDRGTTVYVSLPTADERELVGSQ